MCSTVLEEDVPEAEVLNARSALSKLVCNYMINCFIIIHLGLYVFYKLIYAICKFL